jgi:hypothetical protein
LSPNGLQTVDLRRSSALDLGEVAAAIEEVEGGEARHLERLMVRLQSRARGYLVRHADHFVSFWKVKVLWSSDKNSVPDPYSLNQYPDLALIYGSRSRSRFLMTQNQLSVEKAFCVKHFNRFIARPLKNSKLNKKPQALERKHLQHIERRNFFTFFLCLWVNFACLDPNPIRIRNAGKRLSAASKKQKTT